MISAARVSALAAACTALLMAGDLAVPARAQESACKTDVVTASGRGKFRPFTKTKELEGRGSAMADAVNTWQREVDAKFGERWAVWSKAKDTSFNCAPTKSGKIIGSSFIGCTISGRPCLAPAAALPAAGAAVSDDDTAGAAARARRSAERDEYEGTSWVYRREMQRQRYLLARRDRAESYGWEREKARQRYLEAQRDRAEARAMERATARQRYLRMIERRHRWYDDD
jgi:hypothetical protein